ncbi:molecular chaperone, partial [Chloroflexota bacterium]
MNLPDVNKSYALLAESRLSVYDMLSRLFLELPNEKLVSSILNPEFKNNLDELAIVFESGKIRDGLELISNFISSINNQPPPEIVRSVSVDRTRLLRGINQKTSPPPPYESIYRESRLMGESTSEVSRLYSQFHFNITEEYNEPPDFLGIELDFIRFLCFSEKEAWENNDSTRAAKLLQTGYDFLKNHLLIWAPRYCEDMFAKS